MIPLLQYPTPFPNVAVQDDNSARATPCTRVVEIRPYQSILRFHTLLEAIGRNQNGGGIQFP